MRRRRRRLLLRLLVPVAVVIIAFGVYWLVSARAVVPGLSERMYPIHYREGIARVAERYELDPYLVAAVVRAESNYDPGAVSHAGAIGLMQLMPDTADWVTGLASWEGIENPVLTDPDDNLELGACYLAYLMGLFSDDERAAVASYNAGQGSVDAWLATGDRGGGLQLTDIPYDETREFVERVEHFRTLYIRVHPKAFSDGALRA